MRIQVNENVKFIRKNIWINKETRPSFKAIEPHSSGLKRITFIIHGLTENITEHCYLKALVDWFDHSSFCVNLTKGYR